MKWIVPLYVGKRAEKNKQKIIRGIKKGKLLPGVFVVILSPVKGNQLEIITAAELKEPYYADRDPVIIGLAASKDESFEVIKDIIQDTYDATGEAVVVDYLKIKQADRDAAASDKA